MDRRIYTPSPIKATIENNILDHKITLNCPQRRMIMKQLNIRFCIS